MSVEELRPQYVWQWPVRIVHWTLALTIPALSVTGFYIARPFVAAGDFVMGWMRTVHFACAWAFAIALLVRFVWMFTGNEWARWSQIVPASRKRLRGIFEMARFYLWPVGEPPHHVGHNPLAGVSYIGFYGLAILSALTGFALHGIDADAPVRWMAWLLPLFGGASIARLIHHATMWLMFVFVIAHVYVVVFIARTEKNAIVDGMITGWKLVPRKRHG
jgi:Ni/Fe-hydrogenase 1 B-type cytochrome subunit